MRKCVYYIMMCLLAMPLMSRAQTYEDMAKERKELRKATKSELNEKATKAARKEAKRMRKEGWETAPGALPLDKQLDKSYMMQMEYDENMTPKYMMGEAISVGENYDAAKMQALELAKQNMVGQIQTEITALVENTVANKQLSAGEASSITESVMASKNLISQSIGRILPIVECYRTNKNGNKEVLMRIAYSTELAKEMTKKIIREDLEEKGQDMSEQLEQIL